MSDINPYQAPANDLQGETGTNLAGRGERLAAAIIDGIIASAITVPLGIAYFGGWAQYVEQAVRSSLLLKLEMAALGLLLFLALHGYLLAKNGQTIGKKILGIKIVRQNGDKPELSWLLLRRILPVSVCAMLPFIGNLLIMIDCLMIFQQSRRCLHDMLADTIVVKA